MIGFRTDYHFYSVLFLFPFLSVGELQEDDNNPAFCFMFSGLSSSDNFDTNQLYYVMHFFCNRNDRTKAEYGLLNGRYGLRTASVLELQAP